MSFDSTSLELQSSGFPPAIHPMEPDLFCRQAAMPGHDQTKLENAHVVVVGCGGLGSWIALGLARMGVATLTLMDADLFDRSNAPRQLMFSGDLGKSKATALARNLVPHMTGAGRIRAVVARCEDVLPTITEPIDALVIGVDNNAARLEGARWALLRAIPAVFAMLSGDGLRAQVVRQDPEGPCLWCMLPNMDPEAAAPCAAASIASCYLAAAHALDLVVNAIMAARTTPSWRETSLSGATERACRPIRRPTCVCQLVR